MAAEPTVQISLNSPKQIAFRLMETIANVEHKVLHHNPGTGELEADRRWILDTYAECLLAVKSPRKRLGKDKDGHAP